MMLEEYTYRPILLKACLLNVPVCWMLLWVCDRTIATATNISEWKYILEYFCRYAPSLLELYHLLGFWSTQLRSVTLTSPLIEIERTGRVSFIGGGWPCIDDSSTSDSHIHFCKIGKIERRWQESSLTSFSSPIDRDDVKTVRWIWNTNAIPRDGWYSARITIACSILAGDIAKIALSQMPEMSEFYCRLALRANSSTILTGEIFIRDNIVRNYLFAFSFLFYVRKLKTLSQRTGLVFVSSEYLNIFLEEMWHEGKDR